MILVQAAIGEQIIARDIIKGFKRCFKKFMAGATDRKRKLRKTKRKSAIKTPGRVEIPQRRLLVYLK